MLVIANMYCFVTIFFHSTLIVRFIHVVANSCSWFTYIVVQYAILWIYHNLSILTVCFQFFIVAQQCCHGYSCTCLLVYISTWILSDCRAGRLTVSWGQCEYGFGLYSEGEKGNFLSGVWDRSGKWEQWWGRGEVRLLWPFTSLHPNPTFILAQDMLDIQSQHQPPS